MVIKLFLDPSPHKLCGQGGPQTLPSKFAVRKAADSVSQAGLFARIE